MKESGVTLAYVTNALTYKALPKRRCQTPARITIATPDVSRTVQIEAGRAVSDTSVRLIKSMTPRKQSTVSPSAEPKDRIMLFLQNSIAVAERPIMYAAI